MKSDAAIKLAEQGLKDLANALAGGHSEKLTAYLAVMSKFHQYSFQNCMLIAMQRPDATHVAGFHAWRKLGRFVRKGEHGIGATFDAAVDHACEMDAEKRKTRVGHRIDQAVA